MIKILFVCHGNICRSPMAEYVFNDMISKRGISGIAAESAATSTEETGNPVHRGTVRILSRLGIDCSKKRARTLVPADYDRFDLIVCMEQFNIRNALRALRRSDDPERKLRLLLTRDISDPWYTGDFDTTYEDIREGCEKLIAQLTADNTSS